MQIIDFTKEWLPEAYRLAEENYKEAREVVPLLPDVPIPPLEYFAENSLGTAAVEDGCLLGFLGCFEPWSPAFCTPDTVGMFSPLHAHAVQKENRERIWPRLYQAAGASFEITAVDKDNNSLTRTAASDFFASFIKDLIGFFKDGEIRAPHEQTVGVIAVRAAGLEAMKKPFTWVEVK